MIDHSKLLRLRNFFSAYFHQDCFVNGETSEQIVSDVVASGGPPEELRLLRSAIMDYLADSGEGHLEKELLKDLGAYYLPSADGLTAEQWLRDVASQLVPRQGA